MRPLLLPLVLACSSAAWAQEGKAKTYDLRPHYTLGDRQEVEARLGYVLKVRLTLPSAKIDQTSEFEQRLLRRYRDRLVKIKASKVAEVRRVFLDDWVGERDHGAHALKRRRSPLHHRRIIIGLDASGKREVRVPKGDPDLAASAAEHELHTERYEALLPRGRVAIGATWKVEGKAFQRAMGPKLGQKGGAVCVLKAVKTEALDARTPEDRYAVVQLTVRAGRETSSKTEKREEATALSATLKGELRFSLKRRKIVTVKLRGTARLKKTITEAGKTMTLQGKGPIIIRKRAWFPRRPKQGKKD